MPHSLTDLIQEGLSPDQGDSTPPIVPVPTGSTPQEAAPQQSLSDVIHQGLVDDISPDIHSATLAASDIAPAQAALAARIGNRTGVDPSAIAHSAEDIKKESQFTFGDLPSLIVRHPELSHWLTQPTNVAIARDDVTRLRLLSAQIQALNPPRGMPEDNRPSQPLGFAFSHGAERGAAAFTQMTLAGPAWLQQEIKSLSGDLSIPSPYSPLGMVYQALDTPAAIAEREAIYQPTRLSRFVNQAGGMVGQAPELVAMGLGGSLAVQGSKFLGAAMLAWQAMKGAAVVQAEIAGGEALAAATEQQAKEPATSPGVLAATANIAIQAAIGYAGGTMGANIPILRALNATPFKSAPLQELGQDALRTATAMGAQSLAANTAEAGFIQGRLLTPAEQLETFLSNAAIGSLMAGAHLPAAIEAEGHLKTLRNAEALRFGNMLSDAMATTKESSSVVHSPEEVGKLITAIADRSGIRNVYLQGEEWQDHFVAQGLDPVLEAQKAGLKDEYIRARSLNGDMQVPLKVAIGMGLDSANPEALAGKFRQAPNAPNAVEAITHFQEAPAEVAKNKFLALAKQQIPEMGKAVDAEGTKIYEEHKAQLLAANVPEKEAEVGARLQQRFFTSLAERFNTEAKAPGIAPITAEDLYAHAGLQIRRSASDILSKGMDTKRLNEMLNALRIPAKVGVASALTPAHIALRESLERLGINPAKQTNADIHKSLTDQAQKTTEAAAAEIPHVVSGHRVIVADVPYGGGTSADGKTVYIDRRIPRFIDIKSRGKKTVRIDVHELIADHEIREKSDMATGRSYADSHADALKTENADAVKKYGVSSKAYEKAVRPYVDQALKDYNPAGIPVDLERKPYADMKQEHLLEGAAANPAELLAAKKPIFLEQPGGVKGTFTTGDLSSVIHLFQNANASTVFHETGHYFLETMGKLQALPGAPESLKKDFQRVMEWSGYGSRENMLKMQAELGDLQAAIGDKTPTEAQSAKLKELVAPHETFARGFEQYLMEGRAPAKELRPAFARLKAWMKSVYQDIKNLGVPLNDDIRDVFDRMLASDKEIVAVKRRLSDEPAFETQDVSGMSDEQWASYQKLLEDENRQETESLEDRLMAVRRKAESEIYANERDRVQKQSQDALAQQPVFQALRALQDGETWDGRPLEDPVKLDKDDLLLFLKPGEMEFLPGRGREKNKGREIYTTEGGMSVSDAAPLFGFESADDLIQALIKAPDFERQVQFTTDEQMKLKYPDPMENQPLMERDADMALHDTDARAVRLDMETVAISKILKEREDQFLANKTAAQKEDIRLKREKKIAKLKERIAKNKATADEEREAARLIAEEARQAASQSLEEIRQQRHDMGIAARETIRTMKIADLKPEQFTAAERQSAIKFREAMVKKNYEKAIDAKSAQLMNAELAKAAYDAQEQVAIDRKNLVKSASDKDHRAKIGKAGGWEWTVTYQDGTAKVFTEEMGHEEMAQNAARIDTINHPNSTYERTNGYLDQIDSLLERFDFKKRSNADLRSRESLVEFLSKEEFFQSVDGEMVPTGQKANISASLLQQASKINFKNMTVNELHDIRTAVASLEKMAMMKNKVVTEEGLADLRDHVAQASEAMVAHSLGVKKQKIGNGLADPIISGAGNFFDSLELVPIKIFEMDGNKNGGKLFKIWNEPQQRASDAENVMRDSLRKRTEAVLETWGNGKDPRNLLRRTIPGTDLSINHWNRIVMLMHYGNAEGRQRLADSYGLDDAKAKLVFDGLDKKDIQFANDMIDILGSHWSDVKAMEEKYNGIAPPKVEAIPVVLPNGVFKGGYQRIFYDGHSTSALEKMALRAEESGMTGGGYARPSTVAGSTYSRAANVKDLKIRLSPDDWMRAVNEMTHDLTHRDLVVNQMRILSNKDFRDTMITHWGEGTYQQFVNQIRGIAIGNKPALTAMTKLAEYARITANYSRRAFNPAYALTQYSGIILARTRIQDKYLLGAQTQLMSGPLCIDRMSKWILDQSVTMRYRSRTRDANFGDALSDTTLAGSPRKFMDGMGMFMVVKTWEHMDNITWKGSYDQHMAESNGDHKTSVSVADQIVESLMGSSKQKDIPEIMRGNAATRIFTSNMQWAISNWNGIAQAWHQSKFGLKKPGEGGWKQMATGLGSLATLCVAGPMLWDWLYDEMSGKNMKEWESVKGLGNKALLAPIKSIVTSIPILRDLSPAIFEGRRYEGEFGLRSMKNVSNAFAALHSQHYTKQTAKDVAAGVSTFLPLPSAAFFQAMDGYKYSQRHNADFVHTVWNMANGAPKK